MKPSASQRRIGAFRLAAVRAILCACPDRAPFAPKTVIGAPRSAACLTIYLSRMRLGRASAVRSNSLFNHDIIDLYNRVPVGSPVVVLQEPGPVADLQERGSMTDASEPDVAYGPGPDVGPVLRRRGANAARRLYLVQRGGYAIRYTVGVGREEALNFRGSADIGRKAEWPRWAPTASMIQRMPRYAAYAGGMPGGLGNPLGASR